MKEMKRLLEVMKKLRSPDGCPWDKEQTHESLKKCLLDECAEYFDAVDDKDDNAMREELGDVLMQVVMNSVIAEERHAFTLEDVAHDITEKMIRRHPHVFGDVHVNNTEEVLVNWEKIKKTEHQTSSTPKRKSAVARIAKNLPSLYRAQKLQKKAAKQGFDWIQEDGILDKIQEELNELNAEIRNNHAKNVEEEAGDLLFSIVNFLRFRGLDSEMVLRNACDKFERRYRAMENYIPFDGSEVPPSRSPEEWEILWQKVKQDEKENK